LGVFGPDIVFRARGRAGFQGCRVLRRKALKSEAQRLHTGERAGKGVGIGGREGAGGRARTTRREPGLRMGLHRSQLPPWPGRGPRPCEHPCEAHWLNSGLRFQGLGLKPRSTPLCECECRRRLPPLPLYIWGPPGPATLHHTQLTPPGPPPSPPPPSSRTDADGDRAQRGPAPGPSRGIGFRVKGWLKP
jgi:hypothetical protein